MWRIFEYWEISFASMHPVTCDPIFQNLMIGRLNTMQYWKGLEIKYVILFMNQTEDSINQRYIQQGMNLHNTRNSIQAEKIEWNSPIFTILTLLSLFQYREEREAFIRDKYVHKKFISSFPEGCDVAETLHEAISSNNIRLMLQMLTLATPNDINSISNRGHQSPLHIAALHGDLAMVQLLLWVSTFTDIA